MHNIIKKAAMLILMACMIVTFIPVNSFADSGEDIITVSATSAKKQFTIDGFPYSDSFFSLDCNEYHHELATLSSGLAYASFRNKTETYAADFLDSIGFTDINLKPYETLPTTDSIANCIGSKKIGNLTVIAVGVCGADYEKEWTSNVTVGNDMRADGFNDAAQQVIGRIKEYIETYNIAGEKVLWITGYSRSAATANIVAADMTDSGIFSKVFAYTFATPRTTRDKGNYTNIFNIIDKDDSVPKMPPQEWGYERYGEDLFLLAQEFDSDYPAKAYKAYKAIQNSNFTNNTELAGDYRIILGYLYEFIPSAEKYESMLQNKLRNIISNDEGNKNNLELILEIAEAISPDNEESQKEMDAFITFLDQLIAKYVLYGNMQQIAKNQWIVSKGISSNLFVEHDLVNYISWMLSSDDGTGIYSDNNEFIDLTLNTNADVSIYSDDKFIETIHRNGSADYSGTGYTENDIYIAFTRNGMKVEVDLPLDREYTVIYTPLEDEEGDMVAVKYNATAVSAQGVFSTKLIAQEGVPCVFRSSGDGNINLVANGRDYFDSPQFSVVIPMSIITTLENTNVFNLSVYQLVYVWLIAIGALLLQLILHIALSIYRRVKHKKRSELNIDVTFFINIILTTILGIEVWYYAPSLPFVNEITELICSIIIFVYACGGKNKLLLIPLGIALIASIVLSYYSVIVISTAGVIALIAKQIILAAAAWLIRKKSKAHEKKASTT